MAVQTRIKEQPYYIWFADDRNKYYIYRRLKKALRYGLQGVLNELEFILKTEKDECGRPIYDVNDYKAIKSDDVELIKNGKYSEFYDRTKIDTGYIYLIEDGAVYVIDVIAGEYVCI